MAILTRSRSVMAGEVGRLKIATVLLVEQRFASMMASAKWMKPSRMDTIANAKISSREDTVNVTAFVTMEEDVSMGLFALLLMVMFNAIVPWDSQDQDAKTVRFIINLINGFFCYFILEISRCGCEISQVQ